MITRISSIDQLGYNRLLNRQPLFDPTDELYTPFKTTLESNFTSGVIPTLIRSGEMIGEFNVVNGYLQSSNFVTGVNGWKFDAVGNLEANTGVFRGSIYAAAGNIGDWIIDTVGIYYNGQGTPNIRTAETVGAGTNGVIIDKDGIRGYDAVLGEVFNLYSDGTPPEFTFGKISESIFEVNTNAVIRTSETAGDGSANSAGVLINNSGIFACEANQLWGDANVRIERTGNAYFSGNIDASEITSTTINGGEINGSIITGGLLRTASSGQRTEIDVDGIKLLNGATGFAYGDNSYLYGDADRKYGTGILAYLNNSTKLVPFYVQAEQSVGDIHLVDRTSDPTGAAEIGDLAVVGGELKICTTGGTPGTWAVVGSQS